MVTKAKHPTRCISATQLGEMIGLNAIKIGRRAREYSRPQPPGSVRNTKLMFEPDRAQEFIAAYTPYIGWESRSEIIASIIGDRPTVKRIVDAIFATSNSTLNIVRFGEDLLVSPNEAELVRDMVEDRKYFQQNKFAPFFDPHSTALLDVLGYTRCAPNQLEVPTSFLNKL